MYIFREYYIPERMMESLERYVKDQVLPGDFLRAVISNDLTEAVGRADEENLRNLPAYIGYLYNEAPSRCWGSKERMEEWVKERNGG